VAGEVAARVDAVLPQTQCGACGFGGCQPYAEAISRGRTGINRCTPGGERTLLTLAGLLGEEGGRVLRPADYAGTEGVARIDEQLCIGCTKCIQACPVDAIVGAPKRMHSVLEAACTGCGLCLAPCPVDCIDMLPGPAPAPARTGAGRSRA
jgi:Na+-translocating ferredoxin:NAD+ oxidoreductase subunit B